MQGLQSQQNLAGTVADHVPVDILRFLGDTEHGFGIEQQVTRQLYFTAIDNGFPRGLYRERESVDQTVLTGTPERID